MTDLPPSSPQNPFEGPKRVRIDGLGRGFTMEFRSQSRVLGCLTAVAGLVVGLTLAVVAGIAALLAPLGILIWRGVRWLLARPAAQAAAPSHDGVIDVEATVVLPPSSSAEKSQAPESRPGGERY